MPRCDRVPAIKQKLETVEAMYLEELMASHDAVEGLRAFLGEASCKLGEPLTMSTADIIARCEALYEDLDFTAARKWKEADPSRKVIAYMPVYVPREIIHAGMLPLGIMGVATAWRSSTATPTTRATSVASHARPSSWGFRSAWISSMACCSPASAT